MVRIKSEDIRGTAHVRCFGDGGRWGAQTGVVSRGGAVKDAEVWRWQAGGLEEEQRGELWMS